MSHASLIDLSLEMCIVSKLQSTNYRVVILLTEYVTTGVAVD